MTNTDSSELPPFTISGSRWGRREKPGSQTSQGRDYIEVLESFVAACARCRWNGRVFESRHGRPGSFVGTISDPLIRVFCGADMSHNGTIPIEVFFKMRDE